MKTIVVTTDFSEEAENAVEYAGAFASQLGAKVILFNSFALPVHAANARLSSDSVHKLEVHNREMLKLRASGLTESYGIEADFDSGFVVTVNEGLDELMEKHQADLVVMGMAAKSVAQDLFGNTTTSVIAKLKYPVIAVPRGCRFNGISKILFACEHYAELPQDALQKIGFLASRLNAIIEIFHVEDPGKQEDVRSPEGAQPNGGLNGVVHYFKDVRSDQVIDAIETEMRNIDADLLIMIPKKYGFWESLVHRSKTRMMASNNKVPLLSVPL